MIQSKLKCPKCGASLNGTNSKHQDRECMSCGHIIRGTIEVHELIKANSKEIAEDYLRDGLSDTLAKWRISPTALYRIPEVRELKGKYSKLTHMAQIGDYGRLPKFSDSWDSSVQLKWLSIYEQLLTRSNQE